MALTANSFVSLALRFSRTIGFTPFHEVRNGWTAPISKWKTILMILGCLNTCYCIFGELVYLRIALRSLETFFEAVELVMCIGFLSLSFVKVGTIILNRPLFTWLIEQMSDMFPKTVVEHLEYQTDVYLKKAKQIMRMYSWVQMIMIWLYNTTPLVMAIYDFATRGVWQMDHPYKIWYPMDVYGRGLFEFVFFHQAACGYTSAAGILTADLLLCGVGMQICMQFDRLACRLRQLKARGGQNNRQDYSELRNCIIMHNKLIKLDAIIFKYISKT